MRFEEKTSKEVKLLNKHSQEPLAYSHFWSVQRKINFQLYRIHLQPYEEPSILTTCSNQQLSCNQWLRMITQELWIFSATICQRTGYNCFWIKFSFLPRRQNFSLRPQNAPEQSQKKIIKPLKIRSLKLQWHLVIIFQVFPSTLHSTFSTVSKRIQMQKYINYV